MRLVNKTGYGTRYRRRYRYRYRYYGSGSPEPGLLARPAAHVRVNLDYGKIEKDLSSRMAVAGGRHYGSGPVSVSRAEPARASKSHKAKHIFKLVFHHLD